MLTPESHPLPKAGSWADDWSGPGTMSGTIDSSEVSMKRVLSFAAAALVLSPLAVLAADSSQITGYISDSMCGAKHAGTGAACVKKCIEGGMKPVFVDDSKKQVWAIDNP